MRRSRAVPLTLMTSLPVLLAACGDDDLDISKKYKRKYYSSQIVCQRDYTAIPNACVAGDGGYYGPYSTVSNGAWLYFPYLAGKVSSRAYKYNPKTRAYSVFNDPRVASALSRTSTSRGGFGSTASRSSGSGSISGS